MFELIKGEKQRVIKNVIISLVHAKEGTFRLKATINDTEHEFIVTSKIDLIPITKTGRKIYYKKEELKNEIEEIKTLYTKPIKTFMNSIQTYSKENGKQESLNHLLLVTDVTDKYG